MALASVPNEADAGETPDEADDHGDNPEAER